MFNQKISSKERKRVRIWSCSRPRFSRIWTEYGVSIRIQSECGEMRNRITPNTDTFYALLFQGS